MGKARLLAPWVGDERVRRSAIYHCVSRVVDRRFIFGDAEREQFVEYMRMYELFCGVRVLSFCVMSNHFHILVEVPPRMDAALTDEALLERLEAVYSADYVAMVRMHLSKLSELTTEKGMEAYAEMREKFTRRMWDLGHFMKTLKQRFTRWYNSKNGRCGTLWEARYKSVLVQDGHAARVMAAYIDLNPVRAGMVKDSKDYRWCSYAEAVAGGKRGTLARRGLARVMEERENVVNGEVVSDFDGWKDYPTSEHYEWRNVAQRYRLILFEDGVEVINADGNVKRKGFSKEKVEAAQEKGGKMSLATSLRCKTRYFVDGGVIGGRAFVKQVVDKLKGGYLSESRVSDGSRIPIITSLSTGLASELGSSKEEGEGRSESDLWSMRRLSEE